MNHGLATKRFLGIAVLGFALAAWAFSREPSVAGVWRTADADNLDMTPTIVLRRTGGFQFDMTGRGIAQLEEATARWELKGRAIWIVEEGKREKLADVAEVTATSMILCVADIGVQKFTRIGDVD